MNNRGSSIELLERTLGTEAARGPYQVLPLARIKPNPHQPRRMFAENLEAALRTPEFQDLVASISATGRILQPLLVQPSDAAGNHLIVAGERRYHAARLAGLTEVPVVVVEESDALTLKLFSLIENLHREDLPLWDRARFLAALLEESGLSKKDLAARLGIAPAQLSKYLAVVAAPPDLAAAVQEEIVNDTEAVRLLQEVRPQDRAALLRQARKTGQTVSRRDAERAAGSLRKALPEPIPRRKAPQEAQASAHAPTPQPTEPRVTLPALTRRQLESLFRHLGAELPPEDPAAVAQIFLELVDDLT